MEEFIKLRLSDYRGATRRPSSLPLSDPKKALEVPREGRRHPQTKHALSRTLATEQKVQIALVVGICQRSERNTPRARARTPASVSR